MLKRYGLFLAFLSVLSFPVFAEDDASDKGASLSVDVTAAVVSNYIWRGYDVFEGYAEQQGKQLGSNSGAWAFQPDVTVNFPVEGLFLDIWGSFALQGRDDKDTDGFFQYSPGGDSILISTGAISKDGVAANASDLVKADIDSNKLILEGCGMEAYFSGDQAQCAGTPAGEFKGGVPGSYKEENGLKRVDEIDFVLGYGAESSIGYIETGFLAYLYPNSVGGVGAADKEVYVLYGIPVLEGASVAAYLDIDTSAQYYQAAYEGGVELGDDMTFDYGINAAYAVDSKIQAWHDAGLSLGVSMGGFSVGVSVVQRLDNRWFDGDAAPDNLPVYLEGGSTNGDGMVADPSKTGIVNALVASAIETEVNNALTTAGSPAAGLYTYTARQELPKTLYYLSASYTTTIE